MDQKNKLNILFISRAYPPVVGGIENQNYELSQWLAKITPTTTIANTRGRWFLPFFAPYALFRTLFTLRKYDVILLGDGILSILAWFIKLFSKKPIVAVVHGLDINWDSASLNVWYEKFLIAIYQKLWIGIFIKKIDKFIAVGNETIRVGIDHGIPEKKLIFIPNGVHPEKFIYDDISKDEIFKVIGNKHRNKKILLTFGRLAKRKGVAWFIRKVLSQLPDDIIYVVTGTGPDQKNIDEAIKETGLEKRVVILGYVDDDTKAKIFAGADLFIQANIKVKGDMEGFGITPIEAGVSGLTVLASELEGLKDAIKDNKNGLLVTSEDPKDWKERIIYALSEDFDRKAFGLNARKYITENLSWDKIAKKYYAVLEGVKSNS